MSAEAEAILDDMLLCAKLRGGIISRYWTKGWPSLPCDERITLNNPDGPAAADRIEAMDREITALRADVTRLTASLAAAEAEAIPKHLTSAQVNDACLSYRHDYGLCTESEARFMRRECAEWFRSIRAALSDPAS